MLLALLVFIMKFVDISKLHSQRCACNDGNACNNKTCWQHHNKQYVAEARKHLSSNSSSTSSGCDSGASSCNKENYYALPQQLKQQHHSITPQQLQQLRYYQQLQRQQLCLLQQQLLQRRRLQQQLRTQMLNVKGLNKTNTLSLTCNQQYLLQLRKQQQQPNLMQNNNYNNNNNNKNNLIFESDILNNNNNYITNNVNIVGGVGGFESNDFNGLFQGEKFRRGMTEFCIKNDNNQKTHLSQPLQNSPRHIHQPNNHSNLTKTKLNTNTAQHIFTQQQNNYNFNNNNFNNQQTLQNLHTANTTLANINYKTNATPTSPPETAAHTSPLHYKKPLNSPINSPFAYAYNTQQQHQHQQVLQHLRGNNTKLPLRVQTQYQQRLNDLLAQQQHLQQQQQQLLHETPDESDQHEHDSELSEESLKQNVAIVLNNLDRYNNALRSIILNEQLTSNSCSYLNDAAEPDDIESACSSLLLSTSNIRNNNHNNNNNNFLHISEEEAVMSTAATPESDYNSNATTPGARYDSSMLQQHAAQQHLVGLNAAAAVGGGNSNNALIVGNGVGNNLNCSLISEHDFTHDNSDYQWFLDYGYRDGCGGLQRSVLSSLSASYNTMGDLIYYEDIAKNLDANLAEVDMESFRAEDINSLLWQLPSYCQRLASGNQRLQQSLLLQQQQQQQQQLQHQQQQHYREQQQKLQHNMSQTSTTSTNELIDNSICKSELLFSPVKETHLSVDSLDMDNYPDDGDIILTCKANKDNYTIAFEGSVLYSDDSFYEPTDALRNKQNFINLHSNLDDIVKRKALEVSMSRSEQAHAAYGGNKLLKSSNTHLQRYPSGNNNTSDALMFQRPNTIRKTVRKSNSLPNLSDDNINDATTTNTYSSNNSSAKNSTQNTPSKRPTALNVSQAVSAIALNDVKSMRNLLPMCQIPIYCDSITEAISENCNQHQAQQLLLQQQQQQLQQRHKNHHHHHRRCYCATTEQNVQQIQQQQQQQYVSSNTTTTTNTSSSSGSSNTPALNLVKLFIKQKSSNNCSIESAEAASAHTCMDVSSGCWPSSEAAGSNNSSNSSCSLEQRLRKKSMHDSGKGSALSKHDEEDCETKSGDINNRDVFYMEQDNCATVTNSPQRLQAATTMVMRHPQVSLLANNNHNNKSSGGSSYQSSSTTSEQMTQLEMGKGRGITPTSSQEMITRSMQTSCGTISARSSFSERLRCIPPSFLSKLNTLGDATQAPIYVIYPNYALPDLGFVQKNTNAELIYTPFNYKMAMGETETSTSSLKKRFSMASSELLQQMDYKHVQDWQSLVTLLPTEYRQRLKHIPQVQEVLRTQEVDVQRPLFCMTPPVRRNRSSVCDCVQYLATQTQTVANNEVGGSSSSGSSQPPSSGFRGSSTLLTDSELDNVSNDPLKQMYVYQYEHQRLDSGVECSPNTATPLAKPRGILRRSNSNKRNSMIEGSQKQGKLSKWEKRRSLQEPAFATQTVASSEELEEVFEEEEIYATSNIRNKERLSRRDLDARARAETFLASVPRAELKYYAEIAAILESGEAQIQPVEYDAAALKKEVSRVLSQQKKVSFNDETQQKLQTLNGTQKRFSTPPNSPNISLANGGGALRANNARRYSAAAKPNTIDEVLQRKLENNRFKRLQIQWELMSKDSSMLKELAAAQHTKSGGSTPTSAPKSRIPRPVSYPAGKINAHEGKEAAGSARSPSRIVPPKRYTNPTPTSATPTTPETPTKTVRARTPNSRTPVTAPNTPKRQVPAPRATSRAR